MQAGRHGEQLAEFDIRLHGIVQRKGLGQVFLREDFGFETLWKLRLFLMQHDARRDAGEGFTDGRHIRMRFAVSFAEILLVDQIAMADHDETAVLAGLLLKLKCLVEAGEVHSCRFSDLARVCQGAPAAVFVSRRIVVATFCKPEGGTECHCHTQRKFP